MEGCDGTRQDETRRERKSMGSVLVYVICRGEGGGMGMVYKVRRGGGVMGRFLGIPVVRPSSDSRCSSSFVSFVVQVVDVQSGLFPGSSFPSFLLSLSPESLSPRK